MSSFDISQLQFTFSAVEVKITKFTHNTDSFVIIFNGSHVSFHLAFGDSALKVSKSMVNVQSDGYGVILNRFVIIFDLVIAASTIYIVVRITTF